MAHVEQPGRISQLLPTVKCSNCCQSVALADLSDHICPPSIPALRKPPMSPKSATSLLPQRLQNLVSSPGTPRRPSLDRQPQEHIPARSPSQHDPFQRLPPAVNIRTTPKKSSLPLPAHHIPSPAHASVGRTSPHVRPVVQSAPERVTTPLRNAQHPVLERIRTPSNAARTGPAPPARGAALPNPFDDAPDKSQHTVRPGVVRADRLPPSPPSILKTRSNPMLPPNIHSRPSERARTPSANSVARPSLDKPYPYLDRPPTVGPRPSIDSQHSSSDRCTTSPPSMSVPRPTRAGSTVPLPPPGTVPFPSSSKPVPTPPASMRQPPTPIAPPRSPIPEHERDIDTKIGGEAGMAGVGRRGFAAAARAAMFGATLPQQQVSLVTHDNGRRVNAPHYLDINATMGHVMRAAMTPPLSPNSGYTPSPVSPYPASPVSLGNTTPTSDQYPNLANPPDALSKQDQVSPKPDPSSPKVRIASPSRTPSPIPNPFERRLSGETITQSPIPGLDVQLPLLDGPKHLGEKRDGTGDSDDESIYTTHTSELERARRGDDAPVSPSADSDVGLAYADDSEDDTPVVMPLTVRKSNPSTATNQVKFPTLSSSDRNRSSGPIRKESAASTRSVMSSRSTLSSTAGSNHGRNSVATQSTRSAGALERAMESLIEEGASVSVLASGSVLASISGPSGCRGKPNRSNTVPGPASPEHKPPKLPMRSHTSPSHPLVHSERVGVIGEIARVRHRGAEAAWVCAHCHTKIEDGRWIRMDGGNHLCERCWKNMYLPKCRRCYLPIEKQAVSSKDGQLKGKYHRDCFSCHTCRKPFPDKEFYVFDGKPFCGYHYHEANNSLCAAISCGQPIEGPCAVTHSGKRYHPEHLLCEFEDGCGERLVEYWEVDGQMFCERHAGVWAGRYSGMTRDGVDALKSGRPAGSDEGRAMKRMTRFIDLGSGEDEEVDIR